MSLWEMYTQLFARNWRCGRFARSLSQGCSEKNRKKDVVMTAARWSPPYSPDLAPCDFSLFPKLKENLRGCRYERIEEMKEAVTKVIDTLTQEDFHGAFQKLLERYKFIAAGGDYFEGDESFMYVLSIKVPIRKKFGNLFNELCITHNFQ